MEKTIREKLEMALVEWIEDRKDNIDDASIAAFPEVSRVLLDLLSTKENVV